MRLVNIYAVKAILTSGGRQHSIIRCDKFIEKIDFKFQYEINNQLYLLVNCDRFMLEI